MVLLASVAFISWLAVTVEAPLRVGALSSVAAMLGVATLVDILLAERAFVAGLVTVAPVFLILYVTLALIQAFPFAVAYQKHV